MCTVHVLRLVRFSLVQRLFAHHGLWAPGVRLFRQLRFPSKALLISACFALPLLGLLAWQLMTGAADAREAREDALRQHVEAAHGVLQWAHGLEAGGMPREQAQDLARKAIAQMRYDTNEYFWLNDAGAPGGDAPHQARAERQGRWAS